MQYAIAIMIKTSTHKQHTLLCAAQLCTKHKQTVHRCCVPLSLLANFSDISREFYKELSPSNCLPIGKVPGWNKVIRLNHKPISGLESKYFATFLLEPSGIDIQIEFEIIICMTMREKNKCA